MDIEKAFNKILVFDYNNDENVRKFLEESIVIFEEELENKEKKIERLEYELESCREDIFVLEQREVCPYHSCKFDDIVSEMQDIILECKRR